MQEDCNERKIRAIATLLGLYSKQKNNQEVQVHSIGYVGTEGSCKQRSPER
jgi:hypothetical protein